MREPRTKGPFRVADIAALVGGDVEGDADLLLTAVRSLAEAGPDHLSFLANRRYLPALRATRAGAVLVDRATAVGERVAIRCADPYAAFARVLRLFHPLSWPAPGVDARAWVAPDATVAAGVTVEAFAWIGPGARVGPGAWIEAGAYVGRGAEVGAACRLMPGAVVMEGCVLGDRVWLNPGAVVGSEGFGFAPTADGNVKIPQVARALVEDDVEVGANSCIDRGALEDTRVRRDAKLDNLVQIGHGAEVGERSLLAAFVGISGSTRLGRGVMMGGKSGAVNHVVLGDGLRVTAASILYQDQPPGAYVSGTPAIDHRRWMRASASFEQLPDLVRRLRELEARVAELESARSGE